MIFIKTINNCQTGKFVPCSSKRCLCYKQLLSTATFKSNQTNKTFKIYHQVIQKSGFVVYLLKCYIYSILYIGKSKVPFGIRLNNHGKGAKNPYVKLQPFIYLSIYPCIIHVHALFIYHYTSLYRSISYNNHKKSEIYFKTYLFHDRGRYHIETSPSANQC